jgi:hypothetical protein
VSRVTVYPNLGTVSEEEAAKVAALLRSHGLPTARVGTDGCPERAYVTTDMWDADPARRILEKRAQAQAAAAEAYIESAVDGGGEYLPTNVVSEVVFTSLRDDCAA